MPSLALLMERSTSFVCRSVRSRLSPRVLASFLPFKGACVIVCFSSWSLFWCFPCSHGGERRSGWMLIRCSLGHQLRGWKALFTAFHVLQGQHCGSAAVKRSAGLRFRRSRRDVTIGTSAFHIVIQLSSVMSASSNPRRGGVSPPQQ